MELPEPGAALGDFTVGALLGRGSSGAVFLAFQRSLENRPVALKVLPTNVAGDGARRRFRREARLAAELHHPNLAEVYGFGSEGPWLFFAMQLVEGPTLHEVLARLSRDKALAQRPETRRTLVRYASDVARALEVLHAAGIVHRDVKPSNIILAGGDLDGDSLPDERAVLVDLGLARPFDSDTLTSEGDVLATVPYASREQLLGDRLDARTDVFSLGVTLHDLLTARLPHQRGQASSGMVPLDLLLADANADLVAVLGWACDPSAHWRYKSARVLRADLEAWIEGRPVSARRPPVSERARRWVRTHRRRLTRAGVGLAALGLVLWVGTWIGAMRLGASRVHAAYVAGDAEVLLVEAESLPRLAHRIFLDTAVPSAPLDDGDEALSRILRAHRNGGPKAGLLEAATHMRVHGVGSEPFAVSYLDSQLRAVARRADGKAGSGTPSPAVFLAARLFYERPDVSRENTAASALLRSTLRRLWGNEHVVGMDRLYLLTAFSGCGTWREVDDLHCWAMQRREHSEEQRLALRCVGRILRRAHRCGGLELLNFSELVARQADLCSRTFDSMYARTDDRWQRTKQSPEVRRSFLSLVAQCRSLALAQRATGIKSDLASTLPTDWPSVLDPELDDDRIALCLMAACGDAAVFSRRATSSREKLWGRVTALVRDDVTSVAAEESDAFRDGIHAGTEERRGVLPEEDLSPETLLGHVSENRGRPPNRWHEPDRALNGAVGNWAFGGNAITMAGSARDARLQHADWVPGEHIEFRRFGESRVELDFAVADLPRNRTWRLELEGLAASRAYYPYQGTAELEVQLDGRRIGSMLAEDAGIHMLGYDFSSAMLAPGSHTITLASHARTTTVLWISAGFLYSRDATLTR